MTAEAQYFDACEQLQQSSEALGWNLEYRQLQSGQLRSRIAATQFRGDGGKIGLMRETSNLAVEVVGALPDNLLSVLLPAPGTRLRWNDAYVHGPKGVVILGPGQEFRAVTEAHRSADVLSLTLDTDAIEETLRQISGGDCSGSAFSFNYLPNCEQTQTLRMLMLCGTYLPADARATIELVDNLLVAVARTVVGTRNDDSKSPLTSRDARLRALRRASEFIDGHLAETIRIPDICQYASVSLSTLERIFKEWYGMPPMAYIKARRLDNIRRALRNPQLIEQTIADVALTHGFNHLGRFSAAFYDQFGQFPRQARAR